jgi:hypothetical protein
VRLPILSYTEAALEAHRRPCAEFPNDNPSLHRGAVWFCAELRGEATFEAPAAPATTAEPATDPAPPVLEANDASDDIEIVEDLGFDGDIEDESVPPPSCEVTTEAPEGPASTASSPADDPFLTLVRVLEGVAASAGADPLALTALRTVLGQLRIDADASDDQQRMRREALAWQGILRGESEDYSACGNAMLDEWCAALLAQVLGAPARADGLKRDLRRHGVAAFGLVDQAA